MQDYKWLNEYCLNRFGSQKALEARLPTAKSPAQLRKISADRYLSTMALRVFRAGLKHSLVDSKWPAFEEVFFGFDPEKIVLMGAERLERLMQDTRIIRHFGKLKSVPRNAQMILDVAMEHGSFGDFIADWPVEDITGLWQYIAKHGNQMGGLSAPRFLRMIGKDTFIPSWDVVAALNAQEIVDKVPSSKRDQAAVQAAFNQWHAESGRPMCQLSAMLAFTVNH
ncbi:MULTISPECIES: DNA-3-methyladenine glycosylase I [Pseudomonas]|jgi:3-methyladenine DNA glycosylase Tag|uniref:3-methyladenine DNA glycosylase n=2 Tax=Pseudomonas TaxID=286 RepID=A0A089YN18_9PSED|nr:MULTISPECIES: DNA-3-methyladenine glycosylase I [Pseudomonas]KTC34157.1 3-methyladenine DNA glycosylase [Pseudomonas putida]AIS16929.1 3-methyladenine DNA glycosylase [Pseudomonas rhizosphaerae]KQQ64075.1 3-methyladenine DNA glycosylase [Pseudomonas sp. Leaf129]MBD8754548.1 DNA-3-methyladenine glycosylase I [Pseudomonas coleopterorum]MBD8768456.1 DNA-3-methyladenine glycosylase I [Pseudomonas coleopterorum]